MVVRRGQAEDAVNLAALAERTFRETFEAQNSRDDMEAYCKGSFSPAIQLAQIGDPSLETLLTEVDGALIGYAQLRQSAPPVASGPEPIELWRFYVDRAHHGKGVAGTLLEATLAAARQRRARTLWLGVWEHNRRAQAFYRKVGFVDIGFHQFVLGTDIQTDRIMTRDLG